jgi:hypothetical protein
VIYACAQLLGSPQKRLGVLRTLRSPGKYDHRLTLVDSGERQLLQTDFVEQVLVHENTSRNYPSTDYPDAQGFGAKILEIADSVAPGAATFVQMRRSQPSACHLDQRSEDAAKLRFGSAGGLTLRARQAATRDCPSPDYPGEGQVMLRASWSI